MFNLESVVWPLLSQWPPGPGVKRTDRMFEPRQAFEHVKVKVWRDLEILVLRFSLGGEKRGSGGSNRWEEA